MQNHHIDQVLDHPHGRADILDGLDQYADGNLSYDETVDLFQRLIDSGIVWSLAPSYVRVARALIADGVCIPAP